MIPLTNAQSRCLIKPQVQEGDGMVADELDTVWPGADRNPGNHDKPMMALSSD